MADVRIISFHDKVPKDAIVINTTSRSPDQWSKGLSPFFLGPVKLYKDYVAKNVENGWQYAKVYEQFLENGEPTEKYFAWAQSGWNSSYAQRYPMGKGKKPAYSYWDGEKLGYIDARKKIYIPLYAQAVKDTKAFRILKYIYEHEKEIYLWDFDGYDHKSVGMSYDQVINNPTKTMGHAFVLAMLLEKHL